MTRKELINLIKEVLSESKMKNFAIDKMNDGGYKTEKGKQLAREKLKKLKSEYDSILKLKNNKDYLNINDPQSRIYHNRRLKEIPNEIRIIRKKLLDIQDLK